MPLCFRLLELCLNFLRSDRARRKRNVMNSRCMCATESVCNVIGLCFILESTKRLLCHCLHFLIIAPINSEKNSPPFYKSFIFLEGPGDKKCDRDFKLWWFRQLELVLGLNDEAVQSWRKDVFWGKGNSLVLPAQRGGEEDREREERWRILGKKSMVMDKASLYRRLYSRFRVSSFKAIAEQRKRVGLL